jgi:hypothetical protein
MWMWNMEELKVRGLGEEGKLSSVVQFNSANLDLQLK